MGKPLEYLSELKGVVGIGDSALENIGTRIGGNGDVRFTELQRRVLGDETYGLAGSAWNSCNLLVRGATSSGKTLIAELMMLKTVMDEQRSAVYLVPTKTLVTEKYAQFFSDASGSRLRIYASSADHQAYDDEIGRGDFDIAVIVYEKFYSLLAQKSGMLACCSMLVVDEIQNLSHPSRGAKLEFALTRVLCDYPKTRVLGLLAAEYDTASIVTWLDAVPFVWDWRPTGLNERILATDGTYWERTVPGENEQEATAEDVGPMTGHLAMLHPEGMDRESRKNAMLLSVIKDTLERNPDAQIIVFANSKDRCMRLAQNVAESACWKQLAISNDTAGRAEPFQELMDEIGRWDDRKREKLQHTISAGVAWHTRALASELRERIEQAFRERTLRLIIATETLTEGVNLPVDVMILYDERVNRGREGTVELSPQDYKNYIGRTGRLGQRSIGTSWLFTSKLLETAWKTYVTPRQTAPVRSVFSKLNRSTQLPETETRKSLEFVTAPLFLNFFGPGSGRDSFRERDLTMLWSRTLCGNMTGAEAESSEILKNLRFENCRLVEETERDPLTEEMEYRLTAFGRAMAPYALCITSMAWISNLFYRTDHDGLPADYSGKNLEEETYLLDILWWVCGMEEISTSKYRVLPDISDKYAYLKPALREKAVDYLAEKPTLYMPKGPVAIKIKRNPEPNGRELQRIWKAIALYEWMRGTPVRQISELPGDTGKSGVDWATLRDLGEVAAHLLEAISCALERSETRAEALHKRFSKGEDRNDYSALRSLKTAFYLLSRRVRYGVPDSDICRIFSAGVGGIDRSKALEIAEEAKGYDSLCLYLLSDDHSLRRILREEQIWKIRANLSFEHDSAESKLEAAMKAFPDRVEAITDPIRQICKGDDEDWLDYGFNDLISPYSTRRTPKGCLLGRYCSSFGLLALAHTSDLPSLLEDETLIKGWPLWKGKRFLLFRERDNIELPFNALEKQGIIALRAEDFCCLMIDAADILPKEEEMHINKEVLPLCMHYLCEQPAGRVAYKGTKHTQMELCRFHQKNIDDAIEAYCAEHELTTEEIIRNDNSPNRLYKVWRGEESLFLKVLCIYDKDPRYKELVRHFDPQTTATAAQREEIRTQIPTLEDVDIDAAWEAAWRSREFGRTLPVLLEGYRALRNARRALEWSRKCSSIVPHDTEPVLDYGCDRRGTFWCAVFTQMPYIEFSLDQKQFESNQVRQIGAAICNALEIVHRDGFVHLDIKPSNILCDNLNDAALGEVFLTDFESMERPMMGLQPAVTKKYEALEIRDGQWDARSDIYSLGKTLECLRLKNDENDPLGCVLHKAVSETADDRYQSTEEFRNALLRDVAKQ